MNVSVDFAAALGDRREAYERLLGDALVGSPRRFAREDAVEQMWRIVEPALKAENCGPVYPLPGRQLGPEGGRPHPPRRRRLVPAVVGRVSAGEREVQRIADLRASGEQAQRGDPSA